MNRLQSVVVRVAAVALLGLGAGRSSAAVIFAGFNAGISVDATSDTASPFDVYNESVEYAPTSEPRMVSLDRAGEVKTSGGQTAVRMSSTAGQTSSVSSQPLEVRATASVAFTAHIERLTNYDGAPSVGAVSDFQPIVEVTGGPATYSFSGTLFGLSSVRIFGNGTDIIKRGPSTGTSGEAFNFTGVLEPGRYSFHINASGGTVPGSRGTGDASGSIPDMTLRVTQIPEPAATPLAAAALATFLRRRRARGDGASRPHARPRPS